MKKAILIISKGRNSTHKDYLTSHFSFFKNDISILRKINEVLPSAMSDYDKAKTAEIQQLIKNLKGKDKNAYERFLKANKRLVGDKQWRIIIKNKKISRILHESMLASIHVNRINMFIREMGLVYLITEFEQFLSKSLQVLFDKKPEIIKSKQKQITYEEVFQFDNFNELKELIIEREADSIVNNDIVEINKYLLERLGINLSTKIEWNEFAERFYRRNILVHNNCYPNKIYRNKTGYKGKNKRLNITDFYIRRSFNLFYDFSLFIEESFIDKL